MLTKNKEKKIGGDTNTILNNKVFCKSIHMKNKFSGLIALLVLLIFVSSCGRTIYSSRYSNKKKYVHYKSNNNFWHRHHYRPRAHFGGYW